MQKNNDIFDEIFESSPLEHLIKILPNLSPSALQNALEAIFAEYAIMERVIENENLGDKVREQNLVRDSAIDSRKQDLALRLMHEVLSQGD